MQNSNKPLGCVAASERLLFGSSRNRGDERIRIPTLRVGSLSHWGHQHRGALHAPVRRRVPQANASFAFQPEAAMRETRPARPLWACRFGGSEDTRNSVKNLCLGSGSNVLDQPGTIDLPQIRPHLKRVACAKHAIPPRSLSLESHLPGYVGPAATGLLL